MKEEKKGGRQGKPASEYWQERAIEREALWNKKCRATIEAELAEQYTKALTAIQEDITALYGMFAKDNKLELHEAIALLKGEEYKQWRMSLEAYAKLSETDNAILRELNTLAMRSRVSRLEKLHSETLQELYKLGVATEERMNRFLEGAFEDNYYRSLFEIGRTAGLYSTISAVDDKLLEKVLKNPWSGKAYSARIWANQEKLAQTLKDTVFAGIHRGVSVPKLSRLVKERMEVGRYEATRLVRTELNYVHNQANLESIKDSGMMFYKFVATLDSRTSQKCRAHDGSIVPVEEASPGDNLPPLHPHCRSTIIGSLGEGKGGQKGTRIARDSEGHSFHVPRQMKYSDYKAVYIDQSKTIDQWAAETGFTVAVAKYTPKISSQDSGKSGIIGTKDGASSVLEAIHREQAVVKDNGQRNNYTVKFDLVNSKVYHDKFEGLTGRKVVDEAIYKQAAAMLEHRSGSPYEDIAMLDARTGEILAENATASGDMKFRSGLTEKQSKSLHDKGKKFEIIHNHPNSSIPSSNDIRWLYKRELAMASTIVGHDGIVYRMEKLKPYAEIDDFMDDLYKGLKDIHPNWDKEQLEYRLAMQAIELLEKAKLMRYKKR
ncbi:minor capsid protein [Selenomonas ruminantium]|uniref:minor capsid protein n=1 Tax=Selenomonas ruminantium TaxID=971 RepID=UPI0026F26EEA|nr:minor capsid protein [Selenomonas ruminantium]